ncbi:hypothetical protein HAX54_045453, partial [Datura stramonium]|nr:hypothetical protein [Datura stramonium]
MMSRAVNQLLSKVSTSSKHCNLLPSKDRESTGELWKQEIAHPDGPLGDSHNFSNFPAYH